MEKENGFKNTLYIIIVIVSLVFIRGIYKLESAINNLSVESSYIQLTKADVPGGGGGGGSEIGDKCCDMGEDQNETEAEVDSSGGDAGDSDSGDS